MRIQLFVNCHSTGFYGSFLYFSLIICRERRSWGCAWDRAGCCHLTGMSFGLVFSCCEHKKSQWANTQARSWQVGFCLHIAGGVSWLFSELLLCWSCCWAIWIAMIMFCWEPDLPSNLGLAPWELKAASWADFLRGSCFYQQKALS